MILLWHHEIFYIYHTVDDGSNDLAHSGLLKLFLHPQNHVNVRTIDKEKFSQITCPFHILIIFLLLCHDKRTHHNQRLSVHV